AFTYFHDFGFIPRVRNNNGVEERGFKVVVGGGLGAVSMVAPTAYEFLPVDQIIPFMEAGIRIFDRFGEREKRMKARMKFLVKKFGLDGFMDLIQQEWKALKYKTFPISTNTIPLAEVPQTVELQQAVDQKLFDQWKASNVFEQKQAGYFGVKVRVPLGDISSGDARILAPIIKKYAANDFRLSVNQGFILRFVKAENIPALFNGLHQLGLTKPGFDSIRDITACPGTDTCALGVTNSTGLAAKLEEVIAEEYPDLINDPFLKIKISGCMNACGQHMAANIGFHGSSIKRQTLVIPAMQVVLGGGVDLHGKGFIAEKVIKIPTKRIPQVIRFLLDDYAEKGLEGEYFNDYYYRHGKRYFYTLLKPLADVENIQESEFVDWGQEEQYIQSIGVGECAGVLLDVIGTIIKDAQDRLTEGHAKFELKENADAIYYAYSTFVIGAKALLLSRDIKCNTHKGIINDFQTHFVETGELAAFGNFSDLVLQIRKYEPNEAFAADYLKQAETFLQLVIKTRELQLDASAGADKMVVANYYNA
ncbi:MAG: nitrite reductase, partial [Bacteroidota bacterium]